MTDVEIVQVFIGDETDANWCVECNSHSGSHDPTCPIAALTRLLAEHAALQTRCRALGHYARKCSEGLVTMAESLEAGL